MKIALIRQKYTPFGGAERYMARLIDGLAAKGHEVHVFAAKWDSGKHQNVIFHRVPIISYPGWLKNLTFSINCRRLLGQESFDVIFSLERTLRQDIYRAGDGCHRQWLQQKNLGKGLLSRILTYLSPFQLAYLYLEKRLFQDPELRVIIANSRRGKEEIVNLYGVNPDNIQVVYNGIDFAEVTELKRMECRQKLSVKYGIGEELRILYVGSGFKRKGVPVLLKAVALLDIPFHLFVVGKNPLGGYLSLTKQLGIDKHVTFTGPENDVTTFYNGCDIFVFPTLYDPFSNATLEAMASALPVITTQFNGVAELLINDQNGYVLNDPCNAEQLAEVIKSIQPIDARNRLGREAAETAKLFTMERNIRETMKVIEVAS